LMENCFFYISWMYEFLHRLGQIRSFGDVGSMSGLPEGGHGGAIYELHALVKEIPLIR
jgi:hypothetical protein